MNASQEAVLTAMQECAAASGDGICDLSAADLMTSTGIRSERTVTTARTALREAGLIELLDDPPGRRLRYRVTPATDPRNDPRNIAGVTPAIAPPQSVLSRRAPTRAGTPERADAVEGGEEEVAGTRPPQSVTPAIEPTPAIGTAGVEGIGQRAVRTALEAAREAGGTVPSEKRPRIGHAAQQLAKEESVETILAAARRLGQGGFDDLYTAVRAVKEHRPMPAAVQPPPVEGARTASCIRLIRGTWPRAVIDAELWEEELGKVQERFLLMAVRAIAKSGAEFPPTWGQVYAAARRVGEPIIGAERSERARQAELARDAARLAAS